MTMQSRIPHLVANSERELLEGWIAVQLSATTLRKDLLKESELRRQSATFFGAFREALSEDRSLDINTSAWTKVRGVLSEISASRAALGFTPEETATFIFSLKQPLFNALREASGRDTDTMFAEIWSANTLLDKLGLFTASVFQKSREDVIRRQQREMLELSTPVVKLWDGILALPMIGTLDSERSQVVMESLLMRIVETGAEVAIIDITGVPAVDTLTAQHLLKTIAAARLMGTECIISGIRPQIAQTIVQLGIDLQHVTTKASLADAFLMALRQRRLGVRPLQDRASAGA